MECKECYFKSICSFKSQKSYATKIIGLLSFTLGALSVNIEAGNTIKNLPPEEYKKKAIYLFDRLNQILEENKKAEKCIDGISC